MNEIKLDTIEIDGKEYFLVDTLKDKKEVFDEYYVPLDNENEVLYAMSMFYDKYAS